MSAHHPRHGTGGVSWTVLLILVSALLHKGDTATTDPDSDACLVPLANEDLLCKRLYNFSMCYVTSYVSETNGESLHASLGAFKTIMDKLKAEQCDLNEEYNNECHEGFVSCLDPILVRQDEGHGLSCKPEEYERFLECTRVEMPNSHGPCYYAKLIQLIVNNTRGLDCLPPSGNNIPVQDDVGDRLAEPDVVDGDGIRYYCGNNDLRFHVLDGCRKFREEWVSLGIVYPVQDVPQGTLFDIHVCGLNHENVAFCPF